MTELTYREALHQTIVEEMHKNSDVFIMGECVDEAAMDELFERACCGRFGYDAWSDPLPSQPLCGGSLYHVLRFPLVLRTAWMMRGSTQLIRAL